MEIAFEISHWADHFKTMCFFWSCIKYWKKCECFQFSKLIAKEIFKCFCQSGQRERFCVFGVSSLSSAQVMNRCLWMYLCIWVFLCIWWSQLYLRICLVWPPHCTCSWWFHHGHPCWEKNSPWKWPTSQRFFASNGGRGSLQPFDDPSRGLYDTKLIYMSPSSLLYV